MQWALGLDSWIIQDGNDGDFQRGQEAEFAIEFNLRDFAVVETTEPEARLLTDSTYRVAGAVVAMLEGSWVLDVGIGVFQGQVGPPGLTVGSSVSGEAFLGVDPFFYFEQLHAAQGMPPLIYTWRVERIRRQTAPFKEVAARSFVRDPDRLGYIEIEATDAWGDNGGQASCLLDCSLLDLPPKRTSATAC